MESWPYPLVSAVRQKRKPNNFFIEQSYKSSVNNERVISLLGLKALLNPASNSKLNVTEQKNKSRIP